MAQAQVKAFGDFVTEEYRDGILTLSFKGKPVLPSPIQSLPLGQSVPSKMPGWLILRTVGKIYQRYFQS